MIEYVDQFYSFCVLNHCHNPAQLVHPYGSCHSCIQTRIIRMACKWAKPAVSYYSIFAIEIFDYFKAKLYT